jgi:hypothetical protein
MKKLLLSIVAGLALVAIPVSVARAWPISWETSGEGQCQSDGSFQITWKIKNQNDDKTLTVQESNRAAVPVGSTVSADQTGVFTESVDGTHSGTYKLTIKASWPSDQGLAEKDASVQLEKACKQPSTLTVNKTTSPVGDQTVFSITATTQDGQVYGDATQSIKDGTTVIYKVAPGTYTVVETAVSGWTQTSNTCKGVEFKSYHDEKIANKECEIVNTKNVTPPTGGSGGSVLGTTTTTQVAATPSGSVGAGFGGGSRATNIAAIFGVIGSLGSVGYGLRRLNKSEL